MAAAAMCAASLTPQQDTTNDWCFTYEPRIKRRRITTSSSREQDQDVQQDPHPRHTDMAPSAHADDATGAGGDCYLLPRWKPLVVASKLANWKRADSLTDCSSQREACTTTSEMVNEELICLCPKPDVDSGQVTRGGVRVRAAPRGSRATVALPKPWWWLCLHRVGPVLVMALLCATLWAGVRWRIPHPKLQPGVRHDDHPLRSRSSHRSRLSSLLSGVRHDHQYHTRASKTLPQLPEFSLDPLQLQVDAQTERIMDIYCRGPLLHAVQMANVFPDSKHFVDMPLKPNTSAFHVLLDFEERRLAMTEFHRLDLDETSHEIQLRAFVDDHFDPPGSDFVAITPFDFQEHTPPPQIAGIQDNELRGWAMQLHKLWRHLGRMPQAHITSSFLHAKALDDPHLNRPQNVLIVPGGRFRESYYWDSYWIIEGLLVSNMRATARGVVNNLLEYVAEFGFVPNGGRIYYLTRSQPPMLSDMVKLVANTGRKNASCVEYDRSYLQSAVPILEQEYSFWMQRGPGGHAVEIELPDCQSRDPTKTKSYVLNRYVSNANHARPESYREDLDIAADIFGDSDNDSDTSSDGHTASDTEADKARYYNDVIAAAESGWDFSSRWLRDPLDMRTMMTSCIVPVDLNAVLYRMERNLRAFHLYLGNAKRAWFYDQQAASRSEAMDAVLWNETLGTWKDYNLETHTHSTIESVSDYAPLWAKAFDADRDADKLRRVVASLRHSSLLQVGGVQTTNTFTGQQWDAPNAWPPEQDIVIEGLLAANLPESHELARELAKTWVHTSLTAWRDTGLMFEKYNATEIGGLGVGGEYFPQFGFGWTNGVILKLLTVHQNLLLA